MRWTTTMLVWLVSRGLVLWLLLGPHSWVAGDAEYFSRSLDRVGAVGLGHVLVEYPLPAVGLLAIPKLLVELSGHPGSYAALVCVMAVLTDAGFTALLHGADRRHPRPWGLGVWLLAVPLLGATGYARFDLAPGVLVGAALLLVLSRPRLAGVVAAVATGLKLWPLVILPVLAARGGARWPVVRAFAGTGMLLAGVSLLLGGWSRLVSPLVWQADRGLQIESVLATPAMLRWRGQDTFTVGYTDHNAFEVFGPGVPLLLVGTQVLGVLLVAGLAALWWRAWRLEDRLTAEAMTWVVLAAVTGLMVSSKVLSPQYLLWLLPAAAAGLALAGARPRLIGWCAVLLVTTGLTQLVFPVLYGGLIARGPESGVAIVVLTLRNVLLVGLTAGAWWQAWRTLREPLSAATRWNASRPARRRATRPPCGDARTTPSAAGPKSGRPARPRPRPGARRRGRRSPRGTRRP